MCKGDNMIIYELAYKLMLNGGGSDEALNLFNSLNSNCKPNSSQAFFKALSESSSSLSESSFDQLLQQQLMQGQQRLQSSFYLLLRRHLKAMGAMNFLGLLESHFLEYFALRWK